MNVNKASPFRNSQQSNDFCIVDGDDDLNFDYPSSPINGGGGEKTGRRFGSVLSTLCRVAEEQGLTVSVPVRAVATSAATILAGSVLGGVPGMAVGMITGAVLSYRSTPKKGPVSDVQPSRSNYKHTIRQVFGQMTPQEKKDLMGELIGCLKHRNAKTMVAEILKNKEIRRVAIKILSDFLLQRMGLNLVKGH